MKSVATTAFQVQPLLDRVSERTGLTFPAHRLPQVEKIVRRAMERAGASDPFAYGRRLETDAGAFDDLVAELTVGETYFFREEGHFDLIRTAILPEIRKRHGAGHVFRCWSAGCATGEEAYSLAMLLAEEGLGDHFHVIGTDISRASLTRAVRGRYRDWSFRGEAAARARRWFRRDREEWVLEEEIRRRVVFEYLNLALDSYPSYGTGIWGLDLVLCRNVLIYFDRQTIRGVAGRLWASLAEGGWLVAASTDPPLAGEAPFGTVLTAAGVVYRREPPTAPSFRVPEAVDKPPPARPSPPRVRPSAVASLPSKSRPVRAEPPARKTSLAEAREALARGEYARVLDLTGSDGAPDAAILRVRALSGIEPVRALEAAADLVRRHPVVPEAHYLHAALLLEHERPAEAAEAIRRVLYLDRTLAIAHFTLGSICERLGDREAARRAFRNAQAMSLRLPADAAVPLGDGEQAGRLATASGARLAVLESLST